MKNNIEYYQHYADSHEHPKFYHLRARYGWSGEGMFWALNNMIAKSDGCILDLSRKFSKAPIAEKFKLTIEEFDELIDYLANECELIDLVEGGITTKTVQENFEKVSQDRQKARERKAKWKPKNTSSGEKEKSSPELSKSSGNERRTKQESKVNKSKVNKSKEESKRRGSPTSKIKINQSIEEKIEETPKFPAIPSLQMMIDTIVNKTISSSQQVDVWRARFGDDLNGTPIREHAINFAEWYLSRNYDGMDDYSKMAAINRSGASLFQASFSKAWLSNLKNQKSNGKSSSNKSTKAAVTEIIDTSDAFWTS